MINTEQLATLKEALAKMEDTRRDIGVTMLEFGAYLIGVGVAAMRFGGADESHIDSAVNAAREP